jgi:ribosomal protein S18 acetylase RimI-like enzyme
MTNAKHADIRAVSADDWRVWRDMRLAALAEAPYAFGATLAEWQGEGDTEIRWRARLSTVPLNVLMYLDDAPAGMVSGVAPDVDKTIELISMWVAPFARGRGAGDALVQAVVTWARGQHARRVSLAVVESNGPAIALYRRHGFVDVGPIDCTGSGVASERQMAIEL